MINVKRLTVISLCAASTCVGNAMPQTRETAIGTQQQDSLPAVIAERRQKELEDMMQRQEQFQAKAQQDMEKANLLYNCQ